MDVVCIIYIKKKKKKKKEIKTNFESKLKNV